MPYASLKDINPALKGIKPKISLTQANLIAKWADAMERAEDGPESAWAVAIAQFKKLYRVEGGKWVKKKQKESSMEYKAYTTSTNNVLISVNAIDVGGEAVPVAELVAAYQGQQREGRKSEEQQENGKVNIEEQGKVEGTDKEFIEAVSGSLEDYAGRVKDAFRNAFGRRGEGGAIDSPWTRDVFVDDPDLGTSIVVCDDGKMYSVECEEGEDGFTFTDRGRWQEVVLTYKKIGAAAAQEIGEAQLSESAVGHAIGLAEKGEIEDSPRAPLLLEFALIKPGFGNEKDNHYYPREVLERDARVFEGVKMYATDHRPEEKSVRTEVGIVKKCPVRFEADGTPIGRASIFNPDFAEQVRNRAKADVLDSLENSILALGRTKKGEVDGQKANIVEAITKGQSVDWVTKAGAGGHALNLAESDTGGVKMNKEQIEKLLSESGLPQDAQERLAGAEYEDEEAVKEAILKEQEQAQQREAPQALAEAEVEKAVDDTKLPGFAKAALKARQYADEVELREAVEEATKEVAKLTGSGQPFGQGGGAAPGEQEMSEADYEAAYAEILRRHGLHVPQQQEAA